jgi:hypothetical protein
VTYAYNAFVQGGPCGNQLFVGSAKVTANNPSGTAQPLAAIVNQLNSAQNKGASYNAFDPAGGTSTVVMPLIMDRNSNYYTGFSVTNVGTQTTNVSCQFSPPGPAVSGSLDPGEALTHVQLNVLGNGYVGSATCTASGGDAKIVSIVNELNTVSTGDSFLVYEGTNN